MAFIAVQGSLTLEENTGRKFLALRANVFRRTGKTILITSPYGAFRTPQQQGYLRQGYLTYSKTGLGPVFYYAAPVGQSNHEDGCAFDINNWAAVGEQVIKEEAAKLGLTRDPSERWHWNNLKGPRFAYSSTSLAGVGVTPIYNVSNVNTLDAQQHLVRLKYNIKADGEYGPQTKAAIMDYQGKHGLTKDGIPGPNTMASLRAEVAKLLAAEAAAAAQQKAIEAAAKLARETIPVFELFWDEKGSGFISTQFGTCGLPNMQVYNLFMRRLRAAREGWQEKFLHAEIDIMDSFFHLIVNARLAQVKLDTNKLASAINDELAKKGIKVSIQEIDWSDSVDKAMATAVADAMNAAVPRISKAIIKQSGETLAGIQ